MKYYLLGKSGLRVSELALGAMSFGTEWGWGTEINEARKMLDLYIDNGGNFVDTANVYTNGSSEKMLGESLGEKRQQIVLSTKYTMNTHPGDANGGGNHRKSMVRSVETSLQRLKTDYIDLLYLHIWDGTTPVEEILRAMAFRMQFSRTQRSARQSLAELKPIVSTPLAGQPINH